MIMNRSTRRGVLGALATGVAMPSAAQAQAAGPSPGLRERFMSHFQGLPGVQAIKVLAPAAGVRPEFRIDHNTAERLFIGSAIKAFILCERLRQLDAPGIAAGLATRQLTLDESVWSADSSIFNPPHLTGLVSEQTALEAMIRHSDNTATDMTLRQTGADRVRRFLAEARLGSTGIPDSTRSFFGYLVGAPDPASFSWADLLAAQPKPVVNPPLNDVETLASSADDLVSFYRRSLQGEFFTNKETLAAYRDILSIGDVINIAFPLGGSAFAKGGSIDVPGFHALCIPGAITFAGRWVYFALIINWRNPKEKDAETADRYVAGARAALAELMAGLT